MLISIVIASLFVSFISVVAGLLLIWRKLLTEKYISYLVSFAAGVMLATAFLDLLPEAVEGFDGDNIFIFTLLGIIVFFFLERFLLWFHHHEDTHEMKPTTGLILLGDGLHNFFDGVAIASVFLASPAAGIAATLAIAAHEIPQEMSDFTILVHGGMDHKKALIYNFVSAVTALIGAIGGYYFLNYLENLLPSFIAFSAGMFIYIACSDLIPDMHKTFRKQKGWIQSIPFIVGIILTYILVVYLEH